MKVKLIKVGAGRKLHIADAIFEDTALCSIRYGTLVRDNYDITDGEPNIDGFTGLCKTCRSVALREVVDESRGNQA